MNEPFRVPTPTNYFYLSQQFYYVIIDANGFCSYANPIFLEQNRFSEQDFQGFPFSALLQPGQKTEINSIIEKVMADPARPVANRLYHRFADNPMTLIGWEFQLVTAEPGQPVFIQCVGTVIHEQVKKEDEFVDFSDKKDNAEQLLRSELFYRNLIVESIDGILLTDPTGLISFASPSVEKILGYRAEDLIKTKAFDYVHPADLPLAMSTFQDELKMEPVVKHIDVRLRSKYGEWVYCKVRGHNLMYNPHIGRMAVYFYDDSRARDAEMKLWESEQRFRQLLNNLTTGVLMQSANGYVIVGNKAAYSLLGLTEDQLIGCNLLDLSWDVITENGTAFPIESFPVNVAIATKRQVRDVVMGVYRPVMNDRVWLLVNSEPILDENGEIANIICSFTNISEQKRLSRELVNQEIHKQRLLTQASIDGQERERKEIGKELHDNISQHLTTTRLYLEMIREKTTDQAQEMVLHAQKELSDIITEIKKLSQSLVPPTLGDIGLVESVQDICDSIERTHAFSIDFHHLSYEEEKLPENMKLMLFRIIQEQLNNIIRHAGATEVNIILKLYNGEVQLRLEDNGRGFDPVTIGKKGLGITNIINRAGLFNGKTDIRSSPGQGCTLTVAIPLK